MRSFWTDPSERVYTEYHAKGVKQAPKEARG